MKKLETPKLFVIVVTYNSMGAIETFLSSLASTVRRFGFDVVTVATDNASTDDTPTFLSKASLMYPELNLLVRLNRKNLGLSRAVNDSLRSLKTGDEDVLLICNPDIEFNNSFMNLISASEEQPDRILVPVLLDSNGAEQRVIYRRLPSVARIFSDMTALGGTFSRVFPWIRNDYLYKGERQPEFLEQVGSVCMALRPGTARKLALNEANHYQFYNEAFPVFWNDVDLCNRAAEVGVRIALVDNSRITHGLAHSSKKSNKEMLAMLFYSHAGMMGYARRWRHHPNILRAMLFLDAVFAIAIILRPVHRKRNVTRDVRTSSRARILRFRCSLL